ncbi:MAG: hypothetical protein M3442_09375 [Chloroflexota bacterium]|nr:hypothetical protein [Chloroflexota bacterium]
MQPLDVTNTPELLRLAEEVQATQAPRVLQRDGEDMAVVTPVEPTAPGTRASRRQGKTTSPNDPYWELVGMASSAEAADVSSNKYRYLAEAYASKEQ